MGRPKGRHFDAQFTVLFPRTTLEALRAVAKREKVTLGQLIRTGIERVLADAIVELTPVADDRQQAARSRLKAIETLRLIAEAAMFLSPVGLKIARAKAAEETAD